MIVGAQVIGAERILRELQTLGPRLQQNALKTLKRRAILLVRGVKEKLSGPVLHNRTGHLRASITDDTRLDAGDVVAKIGVFSGPTLVYGRAHEYGFHGRVHVKGHQRTVKKVFGRPISPITVTVRPFDRNMNLAERAFLRTTLAEQAPAINADIDRAVRETLERPS